MNTKIARFVAKLTAATLLASTILATRCAAPLDNDASEDKTENVGTSQQALSIADDDAGKTNETDTVARVALLVRVEAKPAGKFVAALMQNAQFVLARPMTIEKVDVLETKLPH